MIAEFKVENFLSIGSEQTLSFITTKKATRDSDYVAKMKDGTRLLKVAMIFGANATGKSNILKALIFFLKLVVAYPNANEPIGGFNYFLFSSGYKKRPTKMQLTFYFQERKHVLSINFNHNAILWERLDVYFSKRATNIYERKYSNERGSTIFFNEKIVKFLRLDRETIKTHTHRNCTVIAAYYNSGDVAPSNIKGIYEYFRNSFLGRFKGTGGDMVDHARDLLESHQDEHTKAFLEDWMKHGGFTGMSDISFDKETKALTFGYLNKDDQKIELPEDAESSGERRFLGLGALIYEHFTSNCLIVIDGLDIVIHPALRRFFLDSFLEHSQECSQLIFTSNAYYLLDKEFIRRDTVWFTERCSFETMLIRLSDCHITKRQLVYKAYNEGRIVKLPVIEENLIDLTKYKIVNKKKEKEKEEEKKKDTGNTKENSAKKNGKDDQVEKP